MKRFLVAALMAVLLLAAWAALRAPAVTLPGFDEVRRRHESSDRVLLSRSGEVIHESRFDHSIRKLEWTALSGVSPALVEAVLRAEDRGFYLHRGVDWPAIAAAGWDAIFSASRRGASTISMQLAGMIDERLRPGRGRRTVLEKFDQIRAARVLEESWTKQEILEAYLNLVAFRGELQGITAAARGLFGKRAHGLNAAESVILAVLIRSPNAPLEQVAGRALELAGELSLALSAEELSTFVESSLGRPYSVRAQSDLAPHALRMLSRGRESGERYLPSTLDGALQERALQTVRRHLRTVSGKNVHDAAVLVVENRSGDVLAYIGNGQDLSSARHVDGVRAFRQAGSTLKPFLYAAAFEKRLLTPLSLLDDSPLEIPVEGGIYQPSNYDNRFRGPVSARVALASSLNIPAVRVLEMVEVETFVGRLEQLGFAELREADYYGPSLALGAADVRLWDLVNGYRCLANSGQWSELRLDPGVEPGVRRPVFSEPTSFLIGQILSDRESRYETFSLESPLATRYWSAVKTGTSKDMRDNWCVGFSERYTVGVWVGNFSGEPMWNVSGITGAAPIWMEVMDSLHQKRSSRPPRPPKGVVRAAVRWNSGGAAEDWFLEGTEPRQIRPVAHSSVPRILYPPPRTIIALDPDIPWSRQRVFFEADPPSNQLHWMLDGRALASCDSLYPWEPKEGMHRLALVDRRGEVVDRVEFYVRGRLSRVDAGEEAPFGDLR